MAAFSRVLMDRVIALLLPTLALAANFEGIVDDRLLLTDATDPPAVRALSTRSLQMETMVEYTLSELELLGVATTLYDGAENITLHPRGIALLEERYADTVFWADSGAGAILGLRFDSSGLRVLARNLVQPEQLVLDSSQDAWDLAGGRLLYWGDSGSNKVQRCLIDFSVGGAGNCTAGVTDVLTDVRNIAGLAHDPRTSTLYWADGRALRVYSAQLDIRTGVARVPSTLTELVSYVAIPIGLAFERASPLSLGADRLYVLDQELPIRLTRLWLNGNGSDVLVRSGFSRPRAVGLGRAGGFFCVADSGTKKMWFGSVTSGRIGYSELFEAYAVDEDTPFEPRGVAIRSDASLLINLETMGRESDSLDSAAASRRRPLGALTTATALLLGGIVARGGRRR